MPSTLRQATSRSRNWTRSQLADRDGDGIPDASDNCPYYANPNQSDVDQNGRGDLCECSDQNGDGRVDVRDLVAINLAIFNPALATPLCDGNNDGSCDVRDIIAANRSIFSPKTSTCARQPALPILRQARGIAYSTYVGGSNNESKLPDGGGAVGLAIDGFGNRYVTGTTSSTDFPTTPGADQTFGGALDVFVTKLAPSGAVLWSTYLGGTCEDVANDIALDPAGNAYVTGRTGDGCFFGEQAGVVVAKLNSQGAVVYNSVISASLADSSVGHAIAVDAQGHAYVAGTTSSASHDFPTTPGAYRRQECPNVYSFANDVFVAQLSVDGSALLYSTIVCGRGDDVPSSIAIDAAGHAYVGGTTASSDFPTVNPLPGGPPGGPVSVTGFVFKLLPDASDLVYSTYLGGSTNDAVQGIALDAQGNVYVTGETGSLDFPTTPGVVQEHVGNRQCIQPCSDAFVAKIAASGSQLVYSTYLFGELDDAGSDIAVDAAGHAYVIGATISLYFPVVGAFQTTHHGLADAFVVQLAPDATRLLFSSYLGGHSSDTVGEGWDTGSAIALDASGNVHVAGYTQSYDFPTSANAFQPQLGGGICSFQGTPCGDAFVATLSGNAAGPLPPVRVTVEPAVIAPGGTLQVAWNGIPTPTANDHLRICSLGSWGDNFCEVMSSWSTDSAAAGTVLMTLPADLAPGWYDVRLLSPDPDDLGIIKPIGRSEPIQVSAPTATTMAATDRVNKRPSRVPATERSGARTIQPSHERGAVGGLRSPYRASAPSKP